MVFRVEVRCNKYVLRFWLILVFLQFWQFFVVCTLIVLVMLGIYIVKSTYFYFCTKNQRDLLLYRSVVKHFLLSWFISYLLFLMNSFLSFCFFIWWYFSLAIVLRHGLCLGGNLVWKRKKKKKIEFLSPTSFYEHNCNPHS